MNILVTNVTKQMYPHWQKIINQSCLTHVQYTYVTERKGELKLLQISLNTLIDYVQKRGKRYESKHNTRIFKCTQ